MVSILRETFVKGRRYLLLPKLLAHVPSLARQGKA